ncbi:unnamed protein product [Fraxinus pennsylvanica]|uniref:Uncharacterized protein n=1 Tax=Fraxinus pennsylvanica TaxID=56036 RepID=A0AAD2EGH9_9LAMI|nr:unnamed protein product [Fraxinus pennsylvanica]
MFLTRRLQPRLMVLMLPSMGQLKIVRMPIQRLNWRWILWRRFLRWPAAPITSFLGRTSPCVYFQESLALPPSIGQMSMLLVMSVIWLFWWLRMNFLELCDVPFLKEAVAVVGYPQGNVACDTLYTYYLLS